MSATCPSGTCGPSLPPTSSRLIVARGPIALNLAGHSRGPYVRSMPDPLAALLATLAQHYTIEREAGVGGMATGYVARDLKHDRHASPTGLKPELAPLLAVARFLS